MINTGITSQDWPRKIEVERHREYIGQRANRTGLQNGKLPTYCGMKKEDGDFRE
jgi:hypothetical protein